MENDAFLGVINRADQKLILQRVLGIDVDSTLDMTTLEFVIEPAINNGNVGKMFKK